MEWHQGCANLLLPIRICKLQTHNGLTRFTEVNYKLPAGAFADELLLELARWLEQPPGEGHKDDISLLTVDFTTR